MRQLFVLFHSPGEAWRAGVPYLEQPGIEEHIAFMRRLAESGRMVLGGPFATGGATVGMAIVQAVDQAHAERLASDDRSVARGLIRVEVRPWNVPMGSALEALPVTPRT